jgi:hypothetical protein
MCPFYTKGLQPPGTIFEVCSRNGEGPKLAQPFVLSHLVSHVKSMIFNKQTAQSRERLDVPNQNETLFLIRPDCLLQSGFIPKFNNGELIKKWYKHPRKLSWWPSLSWYTLTSMPTTTYPNFQHCSSFFLHFAIIKHILLCI